MQLVEVSLIGFDFCFVYIQKIRHVSLVLNGVEISKMHRVTQP